LHGWLGGGALGRLRTRIVGLLSSRDAGFYAMRTVPRLMGLLSLPSALAGLIGGQAMVQAARVVGTLAPLAFLLGLHPVQGLAALTVPAAALAVIHRLHLSRRSAWRRIQAGESWGMSYSVLRNIEPLQVAGRSYETLANLVGRRALDTLPRHEYEAGRSDAIALLYLSLGLALMPVMLLPPGQRLASLALGLLATWPWLRLPDLMPCWWNLENAGRQLDDLERGSADAVTCLSGAPGVLDARGLCFGYARGAEPLLVDVGLRVEPGQQVGIRGDSQSGKSALARILAGVQAPWAGRLEAGGPVALLENQPPIFAGTLADNVTLGDESIDTGRVVAALEQACLWDEVAERGLDWTVEDGGVNLSGGQRRRLALARLLVARPRVLVVDEAFDAIDRATEDRIRDRLRADHVSLIQFTRRPESLTACDQGWRLEGGGLRPLEPEAAAERKRPPPICGDLPSPLTATVDRETLEALDALARRVDSRPGFPAGTARPPRIDPLHWEARQRGLLLRRVELAGRWWEHGDFPLLARTRGTAVAVLPRSGGGYAVAAGRLDAAAAAGFAKEAHTVHGLASGRTPMQRERVAALVGSLAAGAALPVLPWAVAAGLPAAAAMALTALVLGQWSVSRLLARAASGAAQQREVGHWAHLLALPAGWLRRHPIDDLASLSGDAVWNARTSPGILAAGAKLLAVSACLLALAWPWLTIVLPCWLGGMLAGYVPARAESRRRDALTAPTLAADGTAAQLLAALPQLAAGGCADHLFARWRRLRQPVDGGEASLWSCCRVQEDVLFLAPLIAAWVAAGHGDDAMLLAGSCALAGLAAGRWAALALEWVDKRRRGLRLSEAPRDDRGDVPEPAGVLEARDLAFAYPGASRPLFAGLSFTLAPGEIVALVGPSGCGKTTLLRLALGMERPDAGEVTWNGRPLDDLDRQLLRSSWSAAFQDESLPLRSLRGHLLGRAEGDPATAVSLAGLVGLAPAVARLPMGLFTLADARTLSAGECQRLLLARALATRPSLLILDETCSALETATLRNLFAVLRAAGIGCLFTTHRPDIATLADRVHDFAAGRLAEGRPSPLAAPSLARAPSALPPALPLAARRLYRPEALARFDHVEPFDQLPRLVPGRAGLAFAAALLAAASLALAAASRGVLP